MLIFLIILLALCLYKTKFVRNSYHMQPLRVENVIPLRGILALEIVLGHAYGHVKDNLLYFNNRIGVWVVGIFFFLSGYGLMLSLHRKENYLKGFIAKRIGRIFIPFFIVFLVNFVLGFSSNLFKALLADWFVTEVMVIYLLWYLLYNYLPEKYAFLILFVSVLLLNIFGCYYDIGSRWYGSTACFLFGILYEKKEEKIIAFCKTNYCRVIAAVVLLFLSGSILFIMNESSIAVSAVMINSTCILLCEMICLLLMKFTIGNTITRFLGSISWEIYVSHRTFLFLLDKVEINNHFVYMCLLFGCIVIASWLLLQACKIIEKISSDIGKLNKKGLLQ